MKKAAIIILAVLVFAGITSCQKTKDDVNKATEFDMSYSAQVTIPSSTLVASQVGTTQPIDFNTPDITTSSTSRFTSESTTQSLIDDIEFTQFTMSNPNGNLNFLQSFSIYLRTSDLGDVLIASKSNIPPNSTSVNADLKAVNIKDYIFRDKIQFRINVTLITSTTSSGDQTLKTSQTVHVKGKKI